MATQLRSTRQLSIAGETLNWTEIDPYVWELAFPDGPVIGQIIEIPAHGRNKQTWRRSDTGQPYQSVMTACSDLLTAYYRQQAHPAPAPIEPEERLPAPVLTLVPKPNRPVGVPDGWIKITDAAIAYGVNERTIRKWAEAGKIESVLVPGHGKNYTVRYLAPPPTPAASPSESAPEPPAPALEIVTEDTGRWVTKAEAAKLLGMGLSGVQARIEAGTIPTRKVRGKGARWYWEVQLSSDVAATEPTPEPSAARPAPAPEPIAEQPAADPEDWDIGVMNPPLIDKRQDAPPAGWLKINDAATAYGLTRGRLDGLIERGEVAVCYVKGMGRNGSVRYVPPPPATVAPEPPATGPLPTAAPLSEFASPTIEVQHTPPPDDHLLDADDPPLAPPSEMRLLAAMQRIGYLEAQLEHWQAEATKLTQELETLQWDFNHLAHDYNELEAQRKPRRWFPWGQA